MSGFRVVLLEDDPTSQFFFKRTLERYKHQVVNTYANAETMLEQVENDKAALYLLDYSVDGSMDGLAAAKALEKNCAAAVIFVTGHKIDPREFGKLSNVYSYLMKPIENHELIISVQSAILQNKQKQEQQAYQAFLHVVLEANPEAALLLNDNQELLAMNRKAVRLLGKTNAEAQGHNLDKVLYLLDAEGNKVNHQLLFHNPKLNSTLQTVFLGRPDKGTQTPIHHYYRRIDWNGKSYSVLTMSDRSEVLGYKEQLDTASEMLTQVSNYSPVLMFLYNLKEQCLVYHNREFAKYFDGKQMEEFYTNFGYLRRYVDPDDQHQLDPTKLHELKGESVRRSEMHVFCEAIKKKVLFDVRERVFKWDKEGQVLLVLGLAIDISSEERIVRLEGLKAEMERLLEIKQRFLANVSHEVRTPINGILGVTDYLLQRDLPWDLIKPIHTIHDSSHFLLSIINDILLISRAEMGKLPLHPEPFELRKITQHLRNQFEIRAQQVNLDFDIVENFPEGLQLRGDWKRIQQIATNLVGNALKFTKDGKVEVAISARSYEDESTILQLVVSDTGLGLSKEEQTEIFETFHQVDNSLQREFEGSGLGLSIVQHLVMAMEGTISVDSELGQGTTFSVNLPLEKVQTADLDPIQEDQEAPSHDYTDRLALIVEDKETNRMVLKMQLEQRGIQTMEAERGEEALKLLEEKLPDFILMDVQMPGMSGVECTQEVKMRYPDLPVVGVSAHAMEGDAAKYLEYGMDYYIEKPVTMKRLERVLIKLFRENGSRQTNTRVASREKPEEETLWDPDVIENIGDNSPKSSKLRKEIVKNFENDLQTAHSNLSSQMSLDEMQRAVHALKGLTASMGAHRLNRLATEFDKTLKNKQEPLDDQQIRKLKQTLAQTVGNVSRYIENNEQRPSAY